MIVDPLSHERAGRSLGRGFERVDGEFAVTAVVDTSTRDGEESLARFSVRVDPTDGREDELILTVTADHGRDTRDRRSFRVSVSASGVGNPPRVREVEDALERWYRRQDGLTAAEDVSTITGTV
jgi:hypothetical protein